VIRAEANVVDQVLEYLSKKGYSRTEAMLRKESANIDAQGQPVFTRIEDRGGKMYGQSYQLLEQWVERGLEIYKPELRRLLWPIFVYSFLQAVSDCYMTDAQEFFQNFRARFEEEFADDLQKLQNISEPEHVQENDLAQKYREHKYKLYLSNLVFAALIEFLEAKPDEGGRILLGLIQNHLEIARVDRTIGGARGLQRLLEESHDGPERPPQDEGLPGHHPGSGITDRHAPQFDKRLRLGPTPMEAELMEDVKANLIQEDSVNPPAPGQASLVEHFEHNIKQEPSDDVPPSREVIPYPPSTVRDVAMEVQKVRENRDRFKIGERTGGIGPGISVTMFTFHNTFDSVNCIEFSGDNKLIAIGTAESYIRVFSLENQPLTSPRDPPGQQPSASRRLIGHSGPVYAISFSPSISVPEAPINDHTTAASATSSHPKYMISCSADGTIRLWSLEVWANLVVYRSHNSPIWDVRFSPHGHYFASCSADRTARLWSTPEIAPLRLFVGHDSDVETLAWHPNGAYVITAGSVADRTVRMWDIVSGTCKRLFKGHIGNITAVSCAPNGHVIASGDDKGEIMLWDISSGRQIKRMRSGVRSAIWSLDWSVESSVLVSGGADKAVRVWDVQPIKDVQNKPAGEAAKADGTSIGANGTVTKPAKGKDKGFGPTADLISSFYTKQSPVYKVRFTQMNLVMAGGAYLPERS